MVSVLMQELTRLTKTVIIRKKALCSTRNYAEGSVRSGCPLKAVSSLLLDEKSHISGERKSQITLLEVYSR